MELKLSNFTQLQQQLAYHFKDVSLLRQALTHRSYGKPHNERLEFVGDGILDFIIALSLYQLYPQLSEGELSKMRAALVNQDGLLEIAEQLNLGRYLLLGDGELKSGGRERPSILADAVEAIFAAIVLDSDFNQARQVIEALFYQNLREGQNNKCHDYKTRLQEYTQSKHYQLPSYMITERIGPEHDMLFRVECRINELNLSAQGEGKGKKQASQAAACNLLSLLQESF